MVADEGRRDREHDMSMDDYDDFDDRAGQRRVFSSGTGRRKACKFCTDQDYILDYKYVKVIQTFLTEQGKLVPRRVSGACAFHQRQLTTHIKRARNIGLLGFVTIGT